MIFEVTPISGLVIVDLERHTDERGFFARTWCARESAAAGLPGAAPSVQRVVQLEPTHVTRNALAGGATW